MKVITKKGVVKEELEASLISFDRDDISPFVRGLHTRLLQAKIRFPLLEYCGVEIYDSISVDLHIEICDLIEQLKTIGGNVIIGIILQKRLTEYPDQSIEKATEYISMADAWYICDIIGERVYGYHFLNEPAYMRGKLDQLFQHENRWVIRSLGAGVHYAIKKGLDKSNVTFAFEHLIKRANSKDKEIRQGMGWAAKTTAKFHPDIIEAFSEKIDNEELVENWFRRKIKMGLDRYNYAQRN
ncbi:DNA alkylation repair protein [Ekhidna sp.]